MHSPSPESLHLGAARSSISSSSSSTVHAGRNSSSECTIQVEEDKPYYKKYDEFSISEPKSLPLIPLDEFNPYLIEHPASHPSQSPTSLLTTISQLAYVLGPDNTLHTTEIDTVPCAGIRILHGPLTGLLAWRLVVRLPSSTKEKRGRWNDNTNRRNNCAAPLVQNLQSHTQPYTGASLISYNPSASMSALSLPLLPRVLLPGAGSPNDFVQKFRPSSVVLAPRQAPYSAKTHPQTINRSHPQLDQTSPPLLDALAVNFILDTSLPYSIISRDTLVALGYPPHLIPLPSIQPQDDNSAMVTLSIQNIPTRFRIARPREASRLGVQFLYEAGVSVFFPKDGEGVGPVLYVESSQILKDVPRTVSLQGIGAKLTLAQRVRALLGLS